MTLLEDPSSQVNVFWTFRSGGRGIDESRNVIPS